MRRLQRGMQEGTNVPAHGRSLLEPPAISHRAFFYLSVVCRMVLREVARPHAAQCAQPRVAAQMAAACEGLQH